MALVAHASPTGLLADANATQEEAFYNLARTTTTSVSTLFEALDKILQPVDPEENTEAIKTIVAELRRRAIISVGAMAPPNLCYNEIAAVLTKAGRGFWLGALEEYLGYRYERPGLTRPAASGPPPSAALANLSSSRSNAEEKGRGGPRADPYKSGRLGLQLAKDNKLRSFVDQFPIRLLMAVLTAAAHYAEGKKYYCDALETSDSVNFTYIVVYALTGNVNCCKRIFEVIASILDKHLVPDKGTWLKKLQTGWPPRRKKNAVVGAA